MSRASQERAQANYAAVNGLNLYYEIHGTGGQPLLMLHGAYMSIDAFGDLLPGLAATRQVIAVELQGHGRTADVDRPLRYEQMADDVAALLAELGLASVDIFGYSMGGGVALQVAIRHPQLVRKLIAASAAYNTEGIYPELLTVFDTITPEFFAGSVMETEYKRLAPNPDDFPTLIAKLTELDKQILDWPAEDIQSITAPTMLIIGDSDVVRPEHALEMFRLLGGGVCGDLSGLPNARLAVLPGTTHVAVIDQSDLLLAIIPPFLDAPLPDAA
ncbi:MAG TPA: alpha/beta hydrolase [Herpetosiphonaceae bacterium]